MLRIQPPGHRFALAACLLLAIGSVQAADEETIEVSIEAGGPVEVIRVDNLAIGESRQLTTDSGTPVTVIREAEALLIDLDGQPFEVALPDPEGAGKGFAFVSKDKHEVVVLDADSGDAMTWIDGAADKKRVVVVQGRHEGEDGVAGKRIRILRSDGADVDVDAMVESLGADADGDGHRITVKRRIVRQDEG